MNRVCGRERDTCPTSPRSLPLVTVSRQSPLPTDSDSAPGWYRVTEEESGGPIELGSCCTYPPVNRLKFVSQVRAVYTLLAFNRHEHMHAHVDV